LRGARVWGWGDDPELAGKNAQTYLNRRWKSTMEECSITIDGRDEDVFFEITVYMSKPEGVEDLTNDLFSIALTKADKVYFITVNLYDHMASNERTYRNSLSSVKEAYEKLEQILIQRFKDHPKVRPLLEGGKTLIITPTTSISCELESKRFNKVIVWAGNCDLDPLLDHIHFLAKGLVEHGIATRIVGYSLRSDIDGLTIEDLYTRENKVFLWLSRSSAK